MKKAKTLIFISVLTTLITGCRNVNIEQLTLAPTIETITTEAKTETEPKTEKATQKGPNQSSGNIIITNPTEKATQVVIDIPTQAPTNEVPTELSYSVCDTTTISTFLNCLNTEREKKSLQPLTLDTALCDKATAHAISMAKKGYHFVTEDKNTQIAITISGLENKNLVSAAKTVMLTPKIASNDISNIGISITCSNNKYYMCLSY